MDILSILSIIGIPTIISGLTMLLIKRYYEKKDKIEAKNEKREDNFELLKKEFDDFKNEQKDNNTKMLNRVEESNRLLDSADNMMSILTEALQAIIRDRIIQLYNHYVTEKKYMPIYARESFEVMYKQYHRLGGNGVIKDLVEKLYDLPTDPPEGQGRIQDIDL